MESKRFPDHESSVSASSLDDRHLSLDGDDDLFAGEREVKKSSPADLAMFSESPYSFIQNVCNNDKSVIKQNNSYLLELALNAAHRTDLPLLKYLCEIKIITPDNITQFFSNNKVTLYLLDQLTPSQSQLDLALCKAIFAGASELVERIITLGAKFATSLHEYAYRGDLVAFKEVFAEHAHKKDSLGEIAFSYVLAGGHIQIACNDIIDLYLSSVYDYFKSRNMVLSKFWLSLTLVGKRQIDWGNIPIDELAQADWIYEGWTGPNSWPELFPCNYAIKEGDNDAFQASFNLVYPVFNSNQRKVAFHRTKSETIIELTAFEIAAKYGQVEMLKLDEMKRHQHTIWIEEQGVFCPPTIITSWLLAAFNGHLAVMQELASQDPSLKLSLKNEMYWEMFKLFVRYSPKLENIDPAILSTARVKALDAAYGNQIAPLALGLISLNQFHLNDDQATWESSEWHQQNKTVAGWNAFFRNLTALIHYFIKAGKYGIEHLCRISYHICLYLPLAEGSQRKQLLALITPAIKCLKRPSYHLSAEAHLRVSYIIYNHTVSTNKNEMIQQALHHASLAAKQLDEEKSSPDLRKEVTAQIALLLRSQLSDITYAETPAEEKIAFAFPSLPNQDVIHINADTESQAKLEIGQIKKYLMNSTWNYFYIPTFFTPKITFEDANGKTQTVNVPKHVEWQWKVILAAESGTKSYLAAKNEIFKIACDTAAHPETFGRFRATQTYYEMFLPENYNLYRQYILDDATITNAAKPIPHSYHTKC